MTASCELLPWDSTFFGLNIARVQLERLTSESWSEILDWCTRHRVDCLYYKMPLDAHSATHIAEEQEFTLVDVRIELAREIGAAHHLMPAGIRRARAEDVPELQAIAGASHTLTRFYSDPRFRRDSCDALYRTWIARSCEGYADDVLVAVDGSRLVGYVTLHLEPQRGGRIGLLAAAASARGAGVGRRLIEGALRWCSERSVTLISTATQARNIPGMRLYERSGFLTSAVYLWYHRWFTHAEPAHERTADSV